MRGILVDVTRCTGCNRCVEACTEKNHLREDPAASRFDRGGLAGDRFSAVVPVSPERWARRQCLHCLDPACAAACLVGALHLTPEGAVVYDAEKCIGCRYCMLACPFSIPRYEWDTTRPFVRKCDLCHGRPGGPECVASCPHDALLFGDRDDLIVTAHERIRANPDGYIDRVWGEHEAGGTAVMYVSDVPLDALWPSGLGTKSVPELTWPVVQATPWLGAGAITVLSSLSWIVHRRNRLAEEAAATAAAAVDPAPEGGDGEPA